MTATTNYRSRQIQPGISEQRNFRSRRIVNRAQSTRSHLQSAKRSSQGAQQIASKLLGGASKHTPQKSAPRKSNGGLAAKAAKSFIEGKTAPGKSTGGLGQKTARSFISGIGKQQGKKPQGAISQAGKAAAKKAVKSTVKNSARAASGGTSLVVEAGIALLKTKTGRRIIVGLCLLSLLTWIGLFLLPIILLDEATGPTSQVAGAVNTQAANTALQQTPGVPSGVPTASIEPFEQAEKQTSVPWEILFAIFYYEHLGGTTVANQAGTCPPTTTAPYCPATSTFSSPPPPGTIGPFGYSQKLLSQYGLTKSDVNNLNGALTVTAGAIAQYMQSQNVPGSAGLLSGIQDTGNGMTYTTTPNSVAYDQAMLGALSKLPIANQSTSLDENILTLAQDWELGSVNSAQSGGAGAYMVCANATGKTVSIVDNNGQTLDLDGEQIANAAIISSTAKQMGLPLAASVIATMTALQESSLFNYPNANVPGSIGYPGSQLGGYTTSNPPNNGTSLGLFQQQNNWGSIAQRLNQADATKLFLQRLVAIPNWQSQPYGQDAQTVQGSKYPLAYQPWQQGASTLVGAVSGIKCSAGVSTANLTGVAKTVVSAASAFIGNTPYVWGGGNAAGPTLGASGTGAVGPAGYVGKPGFDCSGLTLYAFAQAGIDLPHYSGTGGQFSIVESSPTFTTNISQLQPGYLVFFVGVGDGGSYGNPGHVGIYIGNGQMINAPTTGQMVSIAPVTQSTAGGFVGGGMPG